MNSPKSGFYITKPLRGLFNCKMQTSTLSIPQSDFFIFKIFHKKFLVLFCDITKWYKTELVNRWKYERVRSYYMYILYGVISIINFNFTVGLITYNFFSTIYSCFKTFKHEIVAFKLLIEKKTLFLLNCFTFVYSDVFLPYKKNSRLIFINVCNHQWDEKFYQNL